MRSIWGPLHQHGTFTREVKGKRGIEEERNTLYLSDLHSRNLPHSRRCNKPYPHGKKLSINLRKVVRTHSFMHEILPSPMSFWCCMTYMNLKAFARERWEWDRRLFYSNYFSHDKFRSQTNSSGWAVACLLSHLPPLVFNSPEEETKTHQLTIPNAGGTLPALVMDTGWSSSEQQTV